MHIADVDGFASVDISVGKRGIPLILSPITFIFPSLIYSLRRVGVRGKDMLVEWYLWIKAAHIMSVIAWMAGLFYLPRLFVYHAERGGSAEPVATLRIMETKLLRVIMNPAMFASWLFGLILASMPGVISFTAVWVWLKLFGILAMTGFHMWLARQRRLMAEAEPPLSGRRYRMMNEVPTVLLVLIVLSVVVKF